MDPLLDYLEMARWHLNPGMACSPIWVLVSLAMILIVAVIPVCYLYLDPDESAKELLQRLQQASGQDMGLSWNQYALLPVLWSIVLYLNSLDIATRQDWRIHLLLIVICVVFLVMLYGAELWSVLSRRELSAGTAAVRNGMLLLLLLVDWHWQPGGIIRYSTFALLLGALGSSSHPAWSWLALMYIALPHFYSTAVVAGAFSFLGYSLASPIFICISVLMVNLGDSSALADASRQLALGWEVVLLVRSIHWSISISQQLALYGRDLIETTFMELGQLVLLRHPSRNVPSLLKRMTKIGGWLFASYLLLTLAKREIALSTYSPLCLLPKQNLQAANVTSDMVHAALLSSTAYHSYHPAFINDSTGGVWELKGHHENASLGAKTFVYHHLDTNTAWVVFRGSAIQQDWLLGNLALFLVGTDATGAHHAGFEENYQALKPWLESTLNTLPKDYSIIICGHSKGGAIAAVAMADLMTRKAQKGPPPKLFTFGQPAVTSAAVLTKLNESGTYFPLVLEEQNAWLEPDPIPLLSYVLFQLPHLIFPRERWYSLPSYYALPACSFTSGLSLHDMDLYADILSLVYYGAVRNVTGSDLRRLALLHLSFLSPDHLADPHTIPTLQRVDQFGFTPNATAQRPLSDCNIAMAYLFKAHLLSAAQECRNRGGDPLHCLRVLQASADLDEALKET